MAVMSGLAGLSNHWRERSFLIWAAVVFLGMGVSWRDGVFVCNPLLSMLAWERACNRSLHRMLPRSGRGWPFPVHRTRFQGTPGADRYFGAPRSGWQKSA